MKNRTTKRTRQCWLIAISLALLGAFFWWNNSALSISAQRIYAPVEQEMRLVHLSDLHGAWFGKNHSRLVSAVEKTDADAIVITGDMIDEMHDSEAAYSLLEEMAKLAPVYCVTGNHEELVRRSGSGEYEKLLEAIENTENAHLLRGETVYLADGVTLTGADDVPFAGGLSGYGAYILSLSGQKGEAFSILLAHRPEMAQHYAAAGFDLTLSGHAHGGQIRLPFIGGLFAPGQGVLPGYDAGLYTMENGTQMYVSRGLGNSIFPLRLFNCPEIAVIDIVNEQ